MKLNISTLDIGLGAGDAATAEDPLLTGLLAFYRFDNSLANADGPNPDLSGSPSYVTGLIGQAISGSASNANWMTGVNWSNTPWTFSFFTKTPASGTGRGCNPTVFVGTNVVSMRVLGSNPNVTLQALLGNGAYTGGTGGVLAAGWHQIAVTYDGALATMYVDGASAGTITGTIPSGTGAVDLEVVTQVNFDTPIDLFYAANVCQSAAQIARLWNSGNGFDPTA